MSRLKHIFAIAALLAGVAAVSNSPTVQARDVGGFTCCYEGGSICLRGDIDKMDAYARPDEGHC